MAEFERALIQERVNAGLAQAKREGRCSGRPKSVWRPKTEGRVRQLEENRADKFGCNIFAVANPKLLIEDLVNLPDGPRIFRLTGPLTLTTVPEFQSKVHSDRSHNLILDFTHVPYVDSIGMGTLVDVNIRHRRDGNSVSLVGASDRVRSVLKLSRVDRFFRFFNSLAEAQAKGD